jgi:hypothetical protein
MELKPEITITNKDLIENWGTDKNKQKFIKDNKVNSSIKKLLMNRALRDCIIKDLGGGKYFIETVREESVPLVYTQIENTIYEYLCPIILQNLIQSFYNKENKLEISLIKYYNLLQSINNNYNDIRYGSIDSCKKLNINIKNHSDFFKESSNYLKRTLELGLEYLEKLDSIKWYKFRMVVIRNSSLKDDPDYVDVGLHYQHRRATEEEIRYELDIKNMVKNKLGIETDQDCYFGSKSKEYHKTTEEEYKKRNIKFFYYGYEIYYTSIEKCYSILSLFKVTDVEKLCSFFNKCVIENNANNRHINYTSSTSSRKHINVDTYLQDYETLLTNAIDINSDDLFIKQNLGIDYFRINGKLTVRIID